MMTLQQGDVLAGKYRLDRALAQGGMGAVWLADHLQLNVTVAVKLMAPALAASADARARFEREAKAAAMLKSPNVVQVHDYGVHGGIPYIVMELLDGEDLEARLVRERRLTPAEVARILVPTCKALRRAHDTGLVHRDLKPANIFLAHHDDDEIVKILDFGIVKDSASVVSARQTVGQFLMGTPHYMSPEQLLSDARVDHRADLWALGVVVFRCMTGVFPFPSSDVRDLIREICSGPIPRPSEAAPDLGPVLDEFFERALARDPRQRFPTAPAFAEAFVGLDWRSSGFSRVMPSDYPPQDARTPSAIVMPARAQMISDSGAEIHPPSGTVLLGEPPSGPGGTVILPEASVRGGAGPRGTVRMVLDPATLPPDPSELPSGSPAAAEMVAAAPLDAAPDDQRFRARRKNLRLVVGVVSLAVLSIGVAAATSRSRSRSMSTAQARAPSPSARVEPAGALDSARVREDTSPAIAPTTALPSAVLMPSASVASSAPLVPSAQAEAPPPSASERPAAPVAVAPTVPKASGPSVTPKKAPPKGPLVRDVQF